MALEYSLDEWPLPDSALALEVEAALQSWRSLVMNLPESALDARRSDGLNDLVHWYESLCADPACDDPAPVTGLDALTDVLAEARPYRGMGHLARIRWAVRVGEELAHWRRCRTSSVGPATVRVAASRLELALKSARRQFAVDVPDSTSPIG